MKQSSFPCLAFAACAAIVGVDGAIANEIQLLPAGEFRAWDGRPADAPVWRVNGAIASRLIADLAARKTPGVIDYEHQTLLAKQNGKPAPAAGWYSSLEWREGVGLFATGVEWTAAAAEMIRAGEYRYISPMFLYDKTGAVHCLLNAALTNIPAVGGMDEVLLAAASAFFAATNLSPINPPPEENMEELLERLRYLLNLPVGATADDVKAQLQKLMDQLGQTATAAASFDLAAHLASQTQTIASLNAQITAPPDPAAYVPMAQHLGLQHECAALSARLEGIERDGLLTAALSDGRILPNLADYWRGQPLTALSAYVAQAQPIAALSGMQSTGVTPVGGAGSHQTTDVDQTVMKALGLTAEQYAAGK